MTATVIKFPVVKLPPERPVPRKARLRFIFDTAVNMVELGLRPENLSANIDPARRRLVELLMNGRDSDGDAAS